MKYKVTFMILEDYHADGELEVLPHVGDAIKLSSTGQDSDGIYKVLTVMRHYHNHKGQVEELPEAVVILVPTITYTDFEVTQN